jgi:serine O-acetyltransferase
VILAGAAGPRLLSHKNFKGYKSLQTYRVAHELWIRGRKELGLLIQSKCSELYGVDIHPGAIIGPGLLMDHATGIVIGETAIIGSNCLMYHGVTLGGTGKSSDKSSDKSSGKSSGKSSDRRHPKIGDNVIIGCGASILGNIEIGSDSKIGADTIVLKSVKPNSIIVGTKK